MGYDLLIHRLLIRVRVTRQLSDPALLLRLRPLYQEALASVSSCKGSSRCVDTYACPYHTAFAQELSADPELVRRHQKPPHPFAWHVPLLTQNRAGEELTLALVLAGRAATHIADHVCGLVHLFAHAQFQDFQLVALDVVGTDGVHIPWPLGTHEVQPELPTPSWEDLLIQAGQPCTKQKIELVTPLRLLAAGKTMIDFEASLFLRHVVRRCSAMAAYYGDTGVDVDYQSLATASSKIALFSEHLRQVRLSSGFQGICGQVGLIGDLSDFWPWLQLGQLLNVGKGAAFGYGDFRLV